MFSNLIILALFSIVVATQLSHIFGVTILENEANGNEVLNAGKDNFKSVDTYLRRSPVSTSDVTLKASPLELFVQIPITY